MSRAERATENPTRAGEVSPDSVPGSEIRALRRALNLTLGELASAASLSVGFLSLIERGQKQPSLEALQRISKALGVAISGDLAPAPPDRG